MITLNTEYTRKVLKFTLGEWDGVGDFSFRGANRKTMIHVGSELTTALFKVLFYVLLLAKAFFVHLLKSFFCPRFCTFSVALFWALEIAIYLGNTCFKL